MGLNNFKVCLSVLLLISVVIRNSYRRMITSGIATPQPTNQLKTVEEGVARGMRILLPFIGASRAMRDMYTSYRRQNLRDENVKRDALSLMTHHSNCPTIMPSWVSKGRIWQTRTRVILAWKCWNVSKFKLCATFHWQKNLSSAMEQCTLKEKTFWKFSLMRQ